MTDTTMQKQDVFQEQIEYLYGYMRLSLAAIALLSAFLVYVLHHVVDLGVLIVWSVAMASIIALRYGSYFYYRRRRQQHAPLFFYLLFFVLMTLNALVFGVGVLYLFVPDSLSHQVFLSFVYAGVSSGASVSLSVRKEMFLIYLAITITPLIGLFYSAGDEMNRAIAAIILVYALFLVFSSLRFEKIILDGIETKFKNDDLLDEISASKAEVELLNEQLNLKLDMTLGEMEKQKIVLFNQSKLVAMGEMIGNIAHQWRQPLSGLSLVLQNLEDAYRYGELDEETFSKLTQESLELISYMSATIEDFRNFVKPSQKEELFDINDALTSTLRLVESALRSNAIETHITYDADSPKAFGIVGEFKQALINLINNSKDAILSQQRGGHLLIHASSDTQNVRIRVEDDGGGIPPEHLERIFEPYFTTKPEGKGSGIGLYMSYVIIHEKLGGKINVWNTQNGAAFEIVLPKGTVSVPAV